MRGNWTHTGWLVALLAAAGLYLTCFDVRRPAVSLRELHGRILKVRGEDATLLELRLPTLVVDCEKKTDGWHLVAPLNARADGERIGRILQALELLPRKEVITPAQRETRGLDWASFELEHPSVSVAVGDGVQKHDLWLGARAPLGDLLYVRLDGSDNVLATTTDILAVLPVQLDDLRDRRLFRMDAARVARVEVKSAEGFLQLAAAGEEWFLRQPIQARADRSRVQRLLGELLAFRVAEFVATGRIDRVSFGLDAAETARQITLYEKGSDIGQTLMVGNPVRDNPDLCYAAWLDPDAVFLVSNVLHQAFGVNVAELRAAEVLGTDLLGCEWLSFEKAGKRLTLEKRPEGWQLVEPTVARADEGAVDTLLGNLASLRAHRWRTLTAGETAGPAEAPWLRLAYGLMTNAAAVPAGEVDKPGKNRVGRTVRIDLVPGTEDLTGRIESEPLRFDIESRAWREKLGMFDPLTEARIFQDRTILNLAPEKIRGVTLSRGVLEQAIERDTNDEWRVVQPRNGSIETGAVAAILGALRPLRACRVAGAHEQPDLAERAAQRLTFRLTGESGIQKTLVFSTNRVDDGILVSVQGQETVYVLPQASAEPLQQDIVR